MNERDIARFWSKVDRKGPDECWDYLGGLFSTGYGAFAVNRKNQGAHRVAYELVKGPIPEGLQVDHVKDRGCNRRKCVNPAHLEAVTCKVNLLRGSTLAADNAAKTHCIHGHPFSGANLYYDALGKRCCRECMNERQRRYQARKRAA